MKKLLNAIVATTLLALTVGAFAQDKMSGKMGSKMQMHHDMMHDMKMTGMVAGKPMGKMFMLSMKGKSMMKVDTSKATFWMKGKKVMMGALKAGSMVTVTGHMMKDHIMASKVEVMPGTMKMGKMNKMSGGKMDKMGKM